MNDRRPALQSAEVRAAIAECRVEEYLTANGVDAVHMGIFDASGMLREKRLSPSSAARAMERGW